MQVKPARTGADRIFSDSFRWPFRAEPGVAITDAIADGPGDAYADGGRWAGSVALRLLRAGIMVEIGTVRSCQPSRHRGRTGQYALADRAAAVRRCADLRCILAAAPATPTRQTLWPD